MSRIRWGLLGCGDVVQRCVGPALRSLSNCELVAISRRNPSALQGCVEKFGAQRGYETWQDLLADDSIQAVYIASPVHLHCEQAVKAAEYGKHVLCEKPMASDARQGQTMVDAARLNQVHLGISYYRHFFPVIRRLKEILAAGNIGDVMQVRIDAAETPLFSEDHPRYWIFDKDKAGGGCLMDFGCHRIEVLLHLLGAIDTVKASTGKVYDRHDVEDVATLLLEFATGAHGVLSVMRGGTEDRDSVTILGTKGAVRVNTLSQGALTVTSDRGSQSETLPPHPNPHLPLIEAFTGSLLEGKVPEVDGHIGLRVQQIVDQAYRSAAGRP
jgi:predicted dehydrogenase